MVCCLADLEGIQSKGEISVDFVTTVLYNIATHFLLSPKYWAQYGRMWCMIRRGMEKRSNTDYLPYWDKEVIDNEGKRMALGAAEAVL